ncbi:MAG TPA: thiol peroxidase [Polyangiaceae bacterium LLY-WYZ-15_(1-7)]|nr:lipid hydroperoxide peroxidase [Myxococcales bacterium]MAT24266.1 lipid hydroperoxide peroxidase [Sandaracinus sp.]HJK89307.1 thiol peroxidase [Polyangiaceae bacterium LLY-WYZ-15_(1-7)]MBJ74223.1 lipid hydroperoxide peroxidase [Sandaracinus sp.]HJL04236.1 thiol peroxidase [Polyangiaceae bacterium LLY-WYZ-15_(1-7)]
MATVTLKGNEIHTNGELPKVGAKAPAFTLVGADLGEKKLADFAGKTTILTINPSYDTGVCQATARSFNQKAGELDATVLMISGDLPFAQKRFCEAEGLEHVVPLSSYRSSFGEDYGLELVDGPLKALTARAVLVLDGEGEVVHAELVPEIAQEPDYDAALAAAKG